MISGTPIARTGYAGFSRIAQDRRKRLGALLLALAGTLVAAIVFGARTDPTTTFRTLSLHLVVETVIIIACGMVYLIGRAPPHGRAPRNLLLLGATFLGVALLGFGHALSFEGMPDLVTPPSVAKAVAFWLPSRLLTVAGLAAAAFLPWSSMAAAREGRRLTALVAGAVALLAAGIFWLEPRWQLAIYGTASGPTPARGAVELVLGGSALAAAWGFWRQSLAEAAEREHHDPLALATASVVLVLSSLAFLLHARPDGIVALLGHLYALAAIVFIYRGIVSHNLRGAEARLQITREAASTAFFEIDLPTGEARWDGDLDQMFGFPRGAPKAMSTLLSRLHPDDRSALTLRLKPGPTPERSFSVEARLIPIDGVERWVALRGEIVRDEGGGAMQALGTVTDVTERKRARQALQFSESRLAAILAIAADAIICIDDAHNITLFNEGAERTFGYDREEVLGKPLALLMPERYRAAHGEHVRHFKVSPVSARSMGQRQEIRALRKDGSEFPADASISKLAVGPSHIYTVVLRDVTERKRLQENLEERVRERTHELEGEIRQREAAQAALVQSQRMDALGQLTGGVAHDSNNLLTVITGNLEMLEEELETSPALKFVREAQEAAAMGARLNQRLLTFSRRRKLEAQTVNLNDQVLSMSELLRRTLGENIRLTTLLAHDLWSTRVDPSEIENAVLNLAINARDAMPDGGNLRIETRNVSLDTETAAQIEGLAPGDYVRLSVSDTGVGMSAEVLRRVFEPFFTTKGPGKGTGLGLSTIYGFVRQSNGHVSIYSEVGLGTTVNVYLPRMADAKSKAGAGGEGTSLPRARGETVLVVEDNPQVRTLTLARVTRLGYRALEAEDGVTALAVIAANPGIALVFSDVVMPGGLSGFDLARAVRERHPGMRVLLTSGFAEDMVRGSDSDESAMLRKPYSLAELARALREALD